MKKAIRIIAILLLVYITAKYPTAVVNTLEFGFKTAWSGVVALYKIVVNTMQNKGGITA